MVISANSSDQVKLEIDDGANHHEARASRNIDLIHLAENFPALCFDNEKLHNMYSLMKEMDDLLNWVDEALERVKVLNFQVKEDMKSMYLYASDSEDEDNVNWTSPPTIRTYVKKSKEILKLEKRISKESQAVKDMLKIMIPSLFIHK